MCQPTTEDIKLYIIVIIIVACCIICTFVGTMTTTTATMLMLLGITAIDFRHYCCYTVIVVVFVVLLLLLVVVITFVVLDTTTTTTIIAIISIHIIESEQRVSADNNRDSQEKHQTLSVLNITCIMKSVIIVTVNGCNNDDIVVSSGLFFPICFSSGGGVSKHDA